ncbi:MAG TPA: serine/threonine-protein kinase, partial [Myxococcaceae bacterium]|nr:serine/threonine-protein kinase [Myxococcaceae bacterium]
MGGDAALPDTRPRSLLSLNPLLPHELPVGTEVGHWRVLGKLGVGGYGAVYLVEDVLVAQAAGSPGLFALKLALREGEEARRLEREAELLTRVRHPNVVERMESGRWPEEPGGLPFLVMRYVKGPRLYTWAQESNRRVAEGVALFRTLARALQALHEAGVVHRDVKGENVLVRQEDGQPMLVDLGAGDHGGAEKLTSGRLPPGTQPYRGPEALRFLRDNLGQPGARYDYGPPDEVYALGVTLYRVLVDAYPYEAEGDAQTVPARLEGKVPVHPSTLNPCVPVALGDVVLRMLAPRREERLASMREVDEALGAVEVDREAWLFEWCEPPSEHSRTTDSTGVWGPVAPEDELALEQGDTQRVLRQYDWRRKRTLRKRPLPVQAPPPATRQPVEAPAGEVGSRREEARILVRARGGVFLLALALFCTPSPLASEGRMMYPSKENPSVNAVNDTRTNSLKLAEHKASSLLERCIVAAGAGVVLAACAGMPVRPELVECSDEAREAMKARRLYPDSWGLIDGHFDDPGYGSEMVAYRTGPIVSRVNTFDPVGDLPLGTLLYGYIWADEKQIRG